jgi:hypothetical protein
VAGINAKAKKAEHQAMMLRAAEEINIPSVCQSTLQYILGVRCMCVCVCMCMCMCVWLVLTSWLVGHAILVGDSGTYLSRPSRVLETTARIGALERGHGVPVQRCSSLYETRQGVTHSDVPPTSESAQENSAQLLQVQVPLAYQSTADRRATDQERNALSAAARI